MSTFKNLLLKTVVFGVTAFGACTAAFASAPGFYVGGQLGQSNTHYDKGDFAINSVQPGSVDSKGTGGRLFVGYQFDQNWSVEGGYTAFKKATADKYPSSTASATIKQDAVDILGKGTLPINDIFGVYAKLGLAYVHAKGEFSNTSFSGSNTEHKVVPAYGIGASIDAAPNVPVFVDFTRMQKSGDIQNADLWSVGIAYHFG